MEYKYYQLNDSQETMMIQQTFSLSKQVMQLPICITMNEQLDFKLLNNALKIEYERNDCLRLRFKKQSGKWRQYFLPSVKPANVKVRNFSRKGKEAQEKFLKKAAAMPVKFKKDDIIHIEFLKTFDGKSAVFINVCHLNMDGVAIITFVRDWLKVYRALKNNTEMPKPLYSFESILINDEVKFSNEKALAKAEEFYTDFFRKDGELIYRGVQGSEFLKDRRERKENPEPRAEKIFDPFKSKSGHICIKEGAEFIEKLNKLAKHLKVSSQCIVEAAIRTHLSKINDFGEDVYFLTVNSGRVAKEKHAGGCKMSLVPTRTIIQENETFSDVATKISFMHMKMYRMCCTRTFWANILAKMYPLRPMYGYYSMLFNWMVMPLAYDNADNFDLRWISTGNFSSELYVFIFPDVSTGGLSFNYEYQLHRITKENIVALHQDVIDIITKAFDEPEITVGRLMREDLNVPKKELCFAD